MQRCWSSVGQVISFHLIVEHVEWHLGFVYSPIIIYLIIVHNTLMKPSITIPNVDVHWPSYIHTMTVVHGLYAEYGTHTQWWLLTVVMNSSLMDFALVMMWYRVFWTSLVTEVLGVARFVCKAHGLPQKSRRNFESNRQKLTQYCKYRLIFKQDQRKLLHIRLRLVKVAHSFHFPNHFKAINDKKDGKILMNHKF